MSLAGEEYLFIITIFPYQTQTCFESRHRNRKFIMLAVACRLSALEHLLEKNKQTVGWSAEKE